jgi:hypothetical protein
MGEGVELTKEAPSGRTTSGIDGHGAFGADAASFRNEGRRMGA